MEVFEYTENLFHKSGQTSKEYITPLIPQIVTGVTSHTMQQKQVASIFYHSMLLLSSK